MLIESIFYLQEEEKENCRLWKTDKEKDEANNNHEPFVKTVENSPSHSFFWNNFCAPSNEDWNELPRNSSGSGSQNMARNNSFQVPASDQENNTNTVGATVASSAFYDETQQRPKNQSGHKNEQIAFHPSATQSSVFHGWVENSDSEAMRIGSTNTTANLEKANLTPYEANSLYGARRDDMEALLRFLSKFDSKVAAIWGESGISSDKLSSTGSSPLQDKLYPWTDYSGPGQSQRGPIGNEDITMDLCSLHLESNNESRGTSDMLDGNSRSQANQPFDSQDSNGKEGIMQSLERYFGPNPSLKSDYHIMRPVDATSSPEETARSKSLLNHCDKTSGFAPYIGSAVDKDYKADRRNSKAVDAEMELLAACSKQKVSEVFVPDEDLRHSWKTHFSTIDYLESVSGHETNKTPVPVVNEIGLTADQINHNLPELRPFNENVSYFLQVYMDMIFAFRLLIPFNMFCRKRTISSFNELEELHSLCEQKYVIRIKKALKLRNCISWNQSAVLTLDTMT